MIDSHCHLQSLAIDDQERALEVARERGVRGFLVPATRLDEAEGILALCERHGDVWCALGVHPHEADSWDGDAPRRLRDLLAAPSVVAVGECGLDFYYDHAPQEKQVEAMLAQFAVAREYELPVVIHNRDSDDRMLDVLRSAAEGLRGEFHSFAGNAALHRELLRMGFYVGVSGMVTFPRADNIRAILAGTPRDRVLLETDTPYLTPVPFRGRPNAPQHVIEVAHRVTQEWGSAPGDVARVTSENFFKLFSRARS